MSDSCDYCTDRLLYLYAPSNLSATVKPTASSTSQPRIYVMLMRTANLPKSNTTYRRKNIQNNLWKNFICIPVS